MVTEAAAVVAAEADGRIDQTVIFGLLSKGLLVRVQSAELIIFTRGNLLTFPKSKGFDFRLKQLLAEPLVF